MQLDITSRSLVNSLETVPGKHSINPVKIPVTMRQSKIESFRPDFVRSSSQAPTFCAVNADSAERKAMGISIPKPIIRSTTPTAADWVSPNVVDNGRNHDEGEIHQHILCSQGNAKVEHLPHDRRLCLPRIAGKWERQRSAKEKQQSQNTGNCLRKHGCQCGTGGAHSESANQQQVSKNVEDTGAAHKIHGAFGISQTPENCGKYRYIRR